MSKEYDFKKPIRISELFALIFSVSIPILVWYFASTGTIVPTYIYIIATFFALAGAFQALLITRILTSRFYMVITKDSLTYHMKSHIWPLLSDELELQYKNIISPKRELSISINENGFMPGIMKKIYSSDQLTNYILRVPNEEAMEYVKKSIDLYIKNHT